VLPSVGGRLAKNWARSKEWSTEYPEEQFSGSSVSVTCPPLWDYIRGTITIDGSEFDYGFGTGNPMVRGAPKYEYQEPTTTWITDVSGSYVDGYIAITLYHDLGESTLTITDTITGESQTFGPDPNGPSVSTWQSSGLEFTAVLNSVDSTEENAGTGFRASFNVIEPTMTSDCYSSVFGVCTSNCIKYSVAFDFLDSALFPEFD